MNDTITRTVIEERIKAIEEERDAFVDMCNKRIIAFNAGIMELKHLIAPEPPTPPIESTEEGEPHVNARK